VKLYLFQCLFSAEMEGLCAHWCHNFSRFVCAKISRCSIACSELSDIGCCTRLQGLILKLTEICKKAAEVRLCWRVMA